jgi:hypothetical protein
MKATANDPVHELKAVLAEHLPWHGARIGFLAQFLLALFKVRSVNLAKRSTGFGGKAQVDSHYKCLQRFFRSFEMDPAHWARLAGASGPGRRWPVAADAGSHPLEVRRGRHPLPGVGYRLSRHRRAGVLERPGQGGQLQHGRAESADGAIPRGLRRGSDRRAAGQPRICGRSVVPLATNATNSLPPVDQTRHPRPQFLEPDDAH